MPDEILEACLGKCEKTWWAMGYLYTDGGVEESDVDCPDQSEEDIQRAVDTSIRRFNQRQRQRAVSKGCPDCTCVLSEAQRVHSEERRIKVRWERKLVLEGHEHTCRYAIQVWVLLAKFRQPGECSPLLFELPPVECD